MPNYLPKFYADDYSTGLGAIKDLVSKKGKGWAALRNLTPFLRFCFSNYDLNFSKKYCFRKLKPTSSDSALLYSLYDSGRNGFKYIKRMRERGKEKLGCCPYCGLPGNITLDHYLPRDLKLFPHYSAYEMNLVPACFSCQLKKRNFSPEVTVKARLAALRASKLRVRSLREKEKTYRVQKRVTGKFLKKAAMSGSANLIGFRNVRKRFIHPYFDDFLKKPVVFLSGGSEKNDSWKIAVKNCSAREKELLDFHLREIGLDYRALGKIGHFEDAVLSHFKRVGIHTYNDARAALPGLLDDALKRGGGSKNYLEAVTIRSLSSNMLALNRLVDLAKNTNHFLEKVSESRKVDTVIYGRKARQQLSGYKIPGKRK
ncbi:HNH endonuclease [Massilia varians]